MSHGWFSDVVQQFYRLRVSTLSNCSAKCSVLVEVALMLTNADLPGKFKSNGGECAKKSVSNRVTGGEYLSDVLASYVEVT